MARRKVKNGEKSPWGQCLTRPVPNSCHRSAFWLGRKTQKFSGTNQKSERRRPFGTGLVRHCPQGLFSLFFTFLCPIFFCPFRLCLALSVCPWVSEDGISHFVTAATKFSCCSSNKEMSPLFFISRSRSLSPFISLSFAGLPPTFSFSLSFSGPIIIYIIPNLWTWQ